jgi:hypothetical protein
MAEGGGFPEPTVAARGRRRRGRGWGFTHRAAAGWQWWPRGTSGGSQDSQRPPGTSNGGVEGGCRIRTTDGGWTGRGTRRTEPRRPPGVKPLAFSPLHAENGPARRPNRWGVGMSDVTRILNAIERGTPRLRTNSCRWCTRNCVFLPHKSYPVSLQARLCKRRHVSRRRLTGTCGSCCRALYDLTCQMD